jgi:hypothetical protein
MTVKNSSLGDRLNDFKNKQSNIEDTEEIQNNIDELKKSVKDLLSSSLSIVTLFIKSAIFGYALKVVFHTDWNFLGFLCIGLTINILAHYLYTLIHNN